MLARANEHRKEASAAATTAQHAPVSRPLCMHVHCWRDPYQISIRRLLRPWLHVMPPQAWLEALQDFHDSYHSWSSRLPPS